MAKSLFLPVVLAACLTACGDKETDTADQKAESVSVEPPQNPAKATVPVNPVTLTPTPDEEIKALPMPTPVKPKSFVTVSGKVIGLNSEITVELGELQKTLATDKNFSFQVEQDIEFSIALTGYADDKVCYPAATKYLADGQTERIIIICNDRLSVEAYHTKYQTAFSQCLMDSHPNDAFIDQLETVDCEEALDLVNDIDQFQSLESLTLSGVTFDELDLSKNPNLQVVSLPDAGLTSLSLPGRSMLTHLDLENSLLTELDLASHKSLVSLNIRGSELTSIDAAPAKGIKFLDFRDSQVSAYTLPDELMAINSGNSLVSAVIKGLDQQEVTVSIGSMSQTQTADSIFEFFVDRHEAFIVKVTDAPLGYYCLPDKYDYVSNKPLSSFVIECKQQITIDDYIAANKNGLGECVKTLKENAETPITLLSDITDLDICYFGYSAYVGYDGYSEPLYLDFSVFPNLTEVFLFEPEAANLDLTKNYKLEKLMVYDHELTSIDLTQNKALVSLGLQKSPQITEIDLTQNTQLKTLNLSESPMIEQLDLSALTDLAILSLGETPKLTDLDLSNNVRLKEIDLPSQLHYLGVDNVVYVSGSITVPEGVIFYLFYDHPWSVAPSSHAYSFRKVIGEPTGFSLTPPEGKICRTEPEIPEFMERDIYDIHIICEDDLSG